MQVKNIQGVNSENIGSVVYAQTFVMIDDNSIYINVTENVPNLQCWMTNINHYESLPVEINTVKNLESEHLGERLRAHGKNATGILYDGLTGLMPVRDELSDTFDDVILNGKLVFYQKGMIFLD